MMFNEETLKEIKAKSDQYDAKVAKGLEKRPERLEKFVTGSGADVKRLYTPVDVQDVNFEEEIGFPGEYPYTRGVQDTMYRGRFWTMRMYAGFATAEASNERYKYLIGAGSMGLSVAMDLPTQIGYDSDDPLAHGEVGKVGVAIDSLADMEILFDGIDLGKVSTSMTINAPASVLLAMYIAVAEKQGTSADKLRGTIQNDVLKEYVARGTYIFPPAQSMRLITNIFEYCSKEVPQWNTISISGYHIREAGSSAAQEVGFTLADGIAYVEAAIKAGLDVDSFAARLSFFFNAHNDLLEEVAKYRAARKLWAKLMKERFGAKNAKSQSLKFHTQTGGSTLTAQQPENNIVRVAIQTLAAVMGGTQSLHTNSKDEALALPTEASVMVALRTQQIVAHESGVTNTIDPLAGSYFVEAKTKEIETQAMEYITKIDDLGGAVVAIEKGYIQQEIMDSAYQYQKDIEEGRTVIVGMNKFQIEEAAPTGLLKVDPSVGASMEKKTQKVRADRDQAATDAALAALKTACEGEDNVMPLIIAAVKTYATLGEVCGVMREVFGEYQQSINL